MHALETKNMSTQRKEAAYSDKPVPSAGICAQLIRRIGHAYWTKLQDIHSSKVKISQQSPLVIASAYIRNF